MCSSRCMAPFQPGTPLASEPLTRLRAEAATRQRTRSARPIGKLPLTLDQGGLDAVLWPWFQRWINNPHNRFAAEWHVIKDKRRYFVALVVSLVLPPREAKKIRANADAVAPKLTSRALPLLRRRLAKAGLAGEPGKRRGMTWRPVDSAQVGLQPLRVSNASGTALHRRGLPTELMGATVVN